MVFSPRYGIESSLVVLCQYQDIYVSFLIGLRRYSKIGSISDNIFTLYYDHMGFIHKLTPDHFEPDVSLTTLGNSRGIFGEVSDIML